MRRCLLALCLLLTAAATAQPDRRPFYVVSFLSGANPGPTLPNCRLEWVADPGWPFGEMELGWSAGYVNFLWHMPQGATGTFEADVWTRLPETHQRAVAKWLPEWLAAHPGATVWIYTGSIDSAGASINPTTKAGSAYLNRGLKPLFECGVRGAGFDAFERTKAMPSINSVRSWIGDAGIEPLPLTAYADGTFGVKSKAWYDIRTFTWDGHLTIRPDRWGAAADSEATQWRLPPEWMRRTAEADGPWLGLDPAGKLKFIDAQGRPYGYNGVVLTAAALPHTAGGRGELDVGRGMAIVDDYLARGWVVDMGVSLDPIYPKHRQLALYAGARQRPEE